MSLAAEGSGIFQWLENRHTPDGQAYGVSRAMIQRESGPDYLMKSGGGHQAGGVAWSHPIAAPSYTSANSGLASALMLSGFIPERQFDTIPESELVIDDA